MKTRAVRLYGENDVRLEEFELRPITSGELLIKIISDSVCMSTHKTILQGAKHLRVPEDVAEHPVIVGHEFCAEVVEVGDKWKDKFAVGDKVVMPPVLSYLGGAQTVGYTFEEIGGVSTYSIVYEHILDNDFLIKLNSDSYFNGSLIEPASCVIRGYKASFHLDDDFNHITGIKEGGKVAILAGCGPMGLVAIDIALHGNIKPSMVVVTDLDKERLERAKSIFSPEKAKENGIELVFVATSDKDELTGGCPNNCVKPDLNDLGVIGQRIKEVDVDKCRGCKKCQIEANCPMKAAFVQDGKVVINETLCNNCGRCAGKCPFGAFGEGKPAWKVTIGGRWGKKVGQGTPLSRLFTSEEEVLSVIEKTILFYREQGLPGERFADTIARLGFDNVEKEILSDEILSRKDEILKDR